MRGEQINRVSSIAIIGLSLTALLTVLSGFIHPPRPPEPDEGTAAHIFQLSIAAQVPMMMLFLATMDWDRPLRSMRPLAFPAAALAFAFVALYHLEHYH